MRTLLERDEQTHAATGYLAVAAGGHGRLVYVGGEAGVGKTTFLEALADHADARVATGWCDGSATPPPLAPLVDMLADLPAGTWPDDATRSQVFANVLAALRDPPGGTPYLLVIEDAHWADEATLDLVRHLARRIHACRALVMVSYRPEDTTAGDGAPGELVAEHHVVTGPPQQAARQRFVEGGQPGVEQVADEVGLGTGPGEGHQLEGALALLVEPGHPRQHGVAHRLRQLAHGGQRLGDEERVAARDGVQLGDVGRHDHSVLGGQLGDPVGGQR
jgi:hypothetical protein